MNLTFSVIILLVGAASVLAAMSVLRVSPILAYFIVGLIAGPSGLGVLRSGEAVHFAAELGIILMLFTIGLKFNISALNSIRGIVFILGGAQVAVSAALFGALAYLWLDDFFLASLVGFVAAMSSTAVVSQILIRENIVTSAAGRRSIGILLFQDIAVIPLIIIYSGGSPDTPFLSLLPLLALKIVLTLAFALLVGPRLTKLWLNWVAQYGDKDLFVLHIVVIVTVAPLITHAVGLSYALGAFLTGMLIAETLHKHRVEQLVEPFRQLFLGFFFMTLGILVDPPHLLQAAPEILLLAAVLLALKIPLVYACARAYKTPRPAALKTALLLGGVGEFGFVLFSVARAGGLLSDDLFQTLVAANMLGLVVTPFLWNTAAPFAQRLFFGGAESAGGGGGGDKQERAGHIIVCGFGRTGQAVSGILRASNVPYVVLEEDGFLLRAANNPDVVYGAGDRAEYLKNAGIEKARVLVITYADVPTASLTAINAKKLNPRIHIINRAVTTGQVKEFTAAGADDVIIDAHETGMTLASHCLSQVRAAKKRDIFVRARNRQDAMFQGEYTGFVTDDETRDLLTNCKIPAEFDGKPLGELVENVKVVGWRRDCEVLDHSDLTKLARGGDEITLSGEAAALEAAREKLIAEGEADADDEGDEKDDGEKRDGEKKDGGEKKAA